jgi:hypothetical protein
MMITLISLSLLFITALGLYVHKRVREARDKRMSQNEYDVAVTVWNYARLVRGEIEQALTERSVVLDFTKMAVPHSQGYRISIELAGASFKVHALPDKHARTGRLSFFTDNSLTVRAADSGGEYATEQDPEYEGQAH